MSDQTAMT